MAVAQCAISTATWVGIAFRERNNFLEIGAEKNQSNLSLFAIR